MVRGSQWGGGLRSPSTSPADTGGSLIRHSSLPAQRYQCRMPRVGQRRWTVDRRGTTGRLRTSHECVSGRGRRYTIASRVRCGLCEKGIILPREGSVITRSTARERRHVPRSSANCTPSYFAAGGNSHSSGSWKVPHSDVMDINIYIAPQHRYPHSLQIAGHGSAPASRIRAWTYPYSYPAPRVQGVWACPPGKPSGDTPLEFGVVLNRPNNQSFDRSHRESIVAVGCIHWILDIECNAT